MKQRIKLGLAASAAGLVNGAFGGGGGMVLAPMLTLWCGMEQKRALATCVAVIFPLCALSASVYVLRGGSTGAGCAASSPLFCCMAV